MTDIDLTIKIVICILAPNVGQYENKHQKFTTSLLYLVHHKIVGN